jgi:putative flippase GtrA
VEQQPAAVAAPTFRARASLALRQRHNWEQLAKFCVVGASGYAVNLAVYALLLNWANLHYTLAATGSFLVAVSNNYLWNRVWTFRHQRGHVAYQGLRFLIVSIAVYGANLLLLTLFVEAGAGKIVAQAIAVVLVTPLNFLGNKLWSFRRRG